LVVCLSETGPNFDTFKELAPMMKYAFQNRVTEWSYSSSKTYRDPFNEVQLDVIFESPDGEEARVPAFWAGEQTWRVRYSSPTAGTHRYRSACSDESNSDLHGQEGALEVKPYEGENPLMAHGPLRVAANRRHLEHRDGTPFFWLGDTWWMGLCQRLRWPGGFRTLTADRVAKGFTVIQIVAGLYPDMPPFDERGANEAGFPWDTTYSRINPAYFDMADLRIDWLVESGLVPCIFGCWGYFLPWTGVDRMKQHWRNLVARYWAYPVVWCLAGEATMPYYLSDEYEGFLDSLSQQKSKVNQRDRERDAEFQKAGWSELAAYIRRVDPRHHPLTIHPTRYGHDQVNDPSVLDIDMLQTGHSGYRTLATTVDMMTETLARKPEMPVLVAEVNYEGIAESSREENQRFLFWSCLLSGAAGHTYGANGIPQLDSRGEAYGLSPHGMSWGGMPWEDASQLPGSTQVGLGKRLLQRYPWWEFEAHPEWVDPHQTSEDRYSAYAAGIPGRVRVVFIPTDAAWPVRRGQMAIKGIEAGVRYRGFYFNPKTGQEHDIGAVTPNAEGTYQLPKPPIIQDWVVVLEKEGLRST
jgi:hypothetical protein